MSSGYANVTHGGGGSYYLVKRIRVHKIRVRESECGQMDDFLIAAACLIKWAFFLLALLSWWAFFLLAQLENLQQ